MLKEGWRRMNVCVSVKKEALEGPLVVFSLTDIIQTSAPPLRSIFFSFVKCKITLKGWRSKRNMIYVWMPDRTRKPPRLIFDIIAYQFSTFFILNLQIWSVEYEFVCISIFTMVMFLNYKVLYKSASRCRKLPESSERMKVWSVPSVTAAALWFRPGGKP